MKYPSIEISFDSYIGKNCSIVCCDDSKIIIKKGVINDGCHLFAGDGGEMRITEAYIGFNSVIVCASRIEINKRCEIAEMVTIRDLNHVFGNGVILQTSGHSTAPIFIGENVWIGAKATVLKGVKIGNNAVIGAGSIVNKDVSNDSLYAGVPAKLIRKTN